MIRSRTLATFAGAVALLCAAAAPAADAAPSQTAYALSNGRLLSFATSAPATTVQTDTIRGVAPGESLVALTVRPQNGAFYALGVNAAGDTGTLYVIGIDGNSGLDWPAGAVPVGAVGSIALTTDGATAVDLPASGYGMAFSPAADRVRVTTTGGLNFRINPNTGTPVDGDNGGSAGSVTGTNPDGALHGASTSAGGIGYTDARLNATATTAYTFDAAGGELALLNPPNAGNQTGAIALTHGGAPFAPGSVAGFAIDPDTRAPASNQPVTAGTGYAALKLGTTTSLYKIDLAGGAVTDAGTIGDGTVPIQSLALPRDADIAGYPAIGLDADGTDTLHRFQTTTPGSQTSLAVTGLTAGEHLAGVSWRTQTGQLVGVGIDAAADTGTIYRIDPQSGAATAIGTPGGLSWVDSGGATVDLPASGWGVDVAPVYDQLRISNANGLNLRASLTSGAPIDGNFGGAAGSVAGTNPDHPWTDEPPGAIGPTSIAYAYAWPHTTLDAPNDVAFALEPGTDKLLYTVTANAGSFSQAPQSTVTLGGTTLDFGPITAADIPWGNGGRWTEVMITSLVVGGTPGLYSIVTLNAEAQRLGTLPTALSALAVGAAELPHPVRAIDDPPPPATHQDDTTERTTPTPTPTPAPYVAPLKPIVPIGTPQPGDHTAPVLKGLKVSTSTKRRLTVSFTASEAGKATIKLTRTVKHGRRTVRKTYRSVAKTINKAGKVTVTFKGLEAGLRLRVEITLKDKVGNAARTALKSATVRR
ncbi:DUF4394 domain-containing protein [Conexibacter woesei]|uniref:DUF4394 domain-containing protein n=1 Tax=Conexibacter woesei TaxID=191495 RepID=UPI000428B0A9|nr:DUF4394 domain-containing protein [Conexibacter woesei]